VSGEQFIIRVQMVGERDAVTGAGRVASATKGMEAAAESAAATTTRSSRTLAQKWTGAGTAATAAGKKVNRGVGLPILALGVITGKFAVDFERQMRNVNSIAQLPERTFKRISTEVRNMAEETGQMPETLAEGLYDLVSSGFDAEESLQILRSGAIAATAGLTTTEVSTKAIAAALNAYKRPASDARQISDDLFQTVNLGVITFDELASSIGYVLPVAATLGVDIKQVGASISTLTKQGQSGSSAITNINAALTAFIKPSKGMAAALKELGYESAETLIRQEGFQGALEKIIGVTDGSKEAIADLFGNVRAMRAVFGLVGDNAAGAAADLRGFGDSAGAAAAVFAEQSKSTAVQAQKLKAEAGALAIEFGQNVIPIARSLIHEVAGLGHAFTGLSPGMQSSIVKAGLFALALGPALRVTGALATGIGKVIQVSKVMAATDLAAGIAQGLRGDTAILRILGGDMAGKVVGGLSKAIPVAAAAAGLGNIIYSATKGDWHDAGFKAGGALVGGIAGAFLGGPAGAALGAGAGSFLGGLIGDMFGDGGEQNAFKKRNEETILSAIRGHKQLIRSSRQVEQSERRLQRVGHAQASVTQRLKASQDRLNAARKSGDTGRVRHEEARLNLLKAKQIHLTHRQWREESLLHAAHVKNVADARRARTVEVALVRTRQAQLEQAQKHERQTRKAFEQAVLQNKPLKEQNQRERDLIDAQKRRKGTSEKLLASEKALSGTMREIATKFGDKFADNLRKQIPLWRMTAKQTRASAEAMHKLAPAIEPISQQMKRFGERGSAATRKVEKGTKQLSQKAPGQLRTVGRGYTDLAETGTEGLSTIGTNTNSFLKSLNAQPVAFTLTAPGSRKGQARGGVTRVPGSGMQDSVPLDGPGIRALVAPGEDVIVANRHQRPELDFAVANTYGDAGLDGFFRRNRRPHGFARGGVAKDGGATSSSMGVEAAQQVLRKVGMGDFPLPRIDGPAPLASGGQNSINLVFAAAADYLRKHAGSPKVRAMLQFAEREAAKGYPYVYGGGHGSFSGPYDCSGFVSAILHAGGFLDTPMSTQQGSGLNTLGMSGAGEQVTWGVRGSSGMNAHTMISLKDIEEGWRFFESGSGHGAAEVGGWSGSFAYRHPAGFARGGILPTGRDADKMPPVVRAALQRYGPSALDPNSRHFVGWGYERGGWVRTGFTTYAGSGGGASGDLQKGNGYAELGTATSGGSGTGHGYLAQALGRSGELPFGFGLEVDVGKGKVGTLYKYDRGYGQGDSAYGLDVHTGGFAAVGLSGHTKGQARIRPADGSGAAASEEKVPAVFRGARTGSLDFPSMPKTLHGVEREIKRRQAEVKRYRHAVKAAKGKPKLEQALQKNVTALETRLEQLRRERSKLRREKAKRKITKRLQRRLGRLTGAEQHMEERERIYNEANEYAEQVVALEPQQVDLPANATEAQRAAAEAKYVAEFEGYVNQKERPAYVTVLGTLNAWRNTTLGGEETAVQLENQWEKKIRETESEIDAINTFTKKVAEREADWKRAHPKAGRDDYPDWLKDQVKEVHKRRARLPVLRYTDNELRNVLGEGRSAFYPGKKEPVEPPRAPLPGTGTFEDVLVGIQGQHWPEQHKRLDALPGTRQAGIFGGAIWDAQESIEGLDLKIRDAAAGLGEAGGGGDEDDTAAEKAQLLEEQNRQLIRELAIKRAQEPVLAGYLGAYEKGGILPGDGFYLGHKGEEVVPADEVGRRGGGVTVLEPHIHVSDELAPYISATVEERFAAAGRSVGLARSTPSAPGRRASMRRRKG
jgi:TP901 family phage tail tape measure protein